LASDQLVVETAFEPGPYEPRLLQAVLDAGQYPESIATARVDVRWFTTGDFSMHYIERQTAGETWECRWDRHPNPHSDRAHFQEPPAGADTTDLELSSLHPLEVYSTVFTAIERRVESLWTA